MPKIEFNKEKCIKCGACIKDCITYSIDKNIENFPKISEDGESRCISCQHCFAICPTGAITFNNKHAQNAATIKETNPQEILNLIKSRRSIRQFCTEEITTE